MPRTALRPAWLELTSVYVERRTGMSETEDSDERSRKEMIMTTRGPRQIYDCIVSVIPSSA